MAVRGFPDDGAARLRAAVAAAGPTLPEIWRRRWSASPTRPALLCPAGSHGPGGPPTAASARWCSAGELEERTRLGASALAGLGLSAGDRMVWLSDGSLAALVAALSALRLGAVLVAANPAYTERELAQVVADVRPRVAVVERREQAAWLGATGAAGAAGRRPGPVVTGPELWPLGPGAGNVGAHPVHLELDRARPEDPALIVFTSGTTGAPKGAVLSHANLAAGALSLGLAWGWEPVDRLVLALPLCHVHGLCVGLFGTLAVGASAVVLPRFDVGAVLDAAGDQQATMFFGVPTMYHRLLASPRLAELGRLRLCVSGSAPLPAVLWERARASVGLSVLERYGMSETLLTLSNPLAGERRSGTVGLSLPGAEVRLGPPPGPEGEAAELYVRGPTVFTGYWERPAATAEAFDGGWFRTGDLATLDEAGYVCIRGRSKELVISGGWNVYPAEVEDVLAGYPGVVEVAVTGTPSEEWGEAVTAWVVTDGSWDDPAPLRAYAADRLAGYKQPRLVHLVSSLPRNALGKVVRAELK